MSLEWTHILAFNIAILGALVSPGPAFIAMLRASMNDGRLAGLRCGVGLATGGLIWSALAIGGLTTLFALVPWAYIAIKVMGAAYLLWLAVTLWRHADAPIERHTALRLTGFRLGLLTNLANPKAAIFIAAIFTTVLPGIPTGHDAMLILTNHLVLEVAWYSTVALVLTTGPAQALYVRVKAHVDRASAAILAALGLRLILDR